MLTDRILVVHLSDGFIEYHGYHQTGEDDNSIKDELDVKAAVYGYLTNIQKTRNK
jgi:hypothetical protein